MTTKTKSKSSATATDAVEMLREDHERMRDLLGELVDTTKRAAKKRGELLAKIRRELLVHVQLEEEIFYPAFRDADGSEHQKIFFEAMEEHRAVVQLVLPDLEQTEPTTEEFSGRAKVLKELIEHHADEEEKDMFPKARKALGRSRLTELGEQMQQRRRELDA